MSAYIIRRFGWIGSRCSFFSATTRQRRHSKPCRPPRRTAAATCSTWMAACIRAAITRTGPRDGGTTRPAGWQVDESFGVGETVAGDGKMRVAGKIFQFKGGEAWFDGEQVVEKPASGHYHHFYYALGYLAFFHKNHDSDPPYTTLYAVPWKPARWTGRPGSGGDARPEISAGNAVFHRTTRR